MSKFVDILIHDENGATAIEYGLIATLIVVVLIGAIKPKVEEGAIIQEKVGLKFSKIKWKYTQQKVTGGAGGNTSGGWDLAANKIV